MDMLIIIDKMGLLILVFLTFFLSLMKIGIWIRRNKLGDPKAKGTVGAVFTRIEDWIKDFPVPFRLK